MIHYNIYIIKTFCYFVIKRYKAFHLNLKQVLNERVGNCVAMRWFDMSGRKTGGGLDNHHILDSGTV